MNGALNLDKDTTILYLFSIAALDRAGWRERAVSMLSPDEKAAYDRIRVDCRRAEYVFGRLVIRCRVGARWNMRPEDVRIRLDPHGKPQLDVSHGQEPLSFNISHSGDLLALALSSGPGVGVDVEKIPAESLPEMEDIARRHFCEAEHRLLVQSPSESRMTTFFRFWTLKESLYKAVGKGLSIPLQAVDVSREQVRYHVHLSHDSKSWCLEAVHLGEHQPGYQIALATLGALGEFCVSDITAEASLVSCAWLRV